MFFFWFALSPFFASCPPYLSFFTLFPKGIPCLSFLCLPGILLVFQRCSRCSSSSSHFPHFLSIVQYSGGDSGKFSAGMEESCFHRKWHRARAPTSHFNGFELPRNVSIITISFLGFPRLCIERQISPRCSFAFLLVFPHPFFRKRHKTRKQHGGFSQ